MALESMPLTIWIPPPLGSAYKVCTSNRHGGTSLDHQCLWAGDKAEREILTYSQSEPHRELQVSLVFLLKLLQNTPCPSQCTHKVSLPPSSVMGWDLHRPLKKHSLCRVQQTGHQNISEPKNPRPREWPLASLVLRICSFSNFPQMFVC